MQAKEAEELRRNWGDKNCDHPAFAKEYDLGAQTGDYICKTCGKEVSRHQKLEIERKRDS